MIRKIADTMIDYHGPGNVAVVDVDILTNYKITCGTVGNKHIT